MKDKMLNKLTVIGRVYSIEKVRKVAVKKEGPRKGQDFYEATLNIAIDEEGLSIVPVFFGYVFSKTKKGGDNKTFQILDKLVTEDITWSNSGKDAAPVVQIDGSLGVNDWYNYEEKQIYSTQRNEGTFITLKSISDLPENIDDRAKFELDMVISKVTEIEGDEERDIKEHNKISGVVFNFFKEMIPVTLSLYDEAGRNYFNSLDLSPKDPLFTKVYGAIQNLTTMKKIEEETAWGGSIVKEIPRNTKSWTLTNIKGEGYEIGEPNTITFDELKEASQNREIKLAEIKKNREDYEASKSAPTAPASGAVTAGDFAGFGL